MLQYSIPGYGRLRKFRKKELLTYLSEMGWEDIPFIQQLKDFEPLVTDEVLIDTLVLDLNGTLTVKGKMVEGVIQPLREIQLKEVRLILLTGDVRGSASEVKEQLDSEGVSIKLIVCKGSSGTALSKLSELLKLDYSRVAFIGNGQGDALAVRLAEFSLAVSQGDLAASQTIRGAIGHATSIVDALNTLLCEKTMIGAFHQ